MKLYEYIREENTRTVRILGFPIMRQTSDYMTSERYQEFLGGLITTVKVNSKTCDCTNKEMKLLGKSIIKRIDENNYRIYSFLGKEYIKISLIKEFEKLYLKNFSEEYDDIYILRANSGEVYLTLTYLIDSIIKKNGSKNPLLVATKKYHIDIIRMICPDIPFVYIDNFKLKISGSSFKIKNFRFFLLFDTSYFRQVELDIKAKELGEYHYFDALLNKFNLSETDLKMRKIKVLPEAEQSMLEKVERLGLNLENFVFLAPEAMSCQLYDEKFWSDLIKQLQQNGYDVFINLVGKDIKFKSASDYKTCYLSFAEAFALAKRAKKIVSLRSGFTEFLLQTEVPMYVLYTKFRQRHIFNDVDSSHVLSGFGLSHLPFVDKSKIYEFNVLKMTLSGCVCKIAL